MLLLSYKSKDLGLLPEKLLSLQEVINYLTNLNDSIMVYVREIYANNEEGTKVYEMSNGLFCTKNADGKWKICETSSALTE